MKTYFWSFGGERFMLKGSDVWYLHTEQRKVYVHTCNRNYRMGGTLKMAAQLFGTLPLIRIHAAYLVHPGRLERINAHRALLKNGEELPVSERFWPSAREAVERYYQNNGQAE